MNKHNNSDAPKAAIIYSVSHNKEIKDLELSLEFLETNLISIKKYPIIVLHNGLDDKDIERINKSHSLTILFEKIEVMQHKSNEKEKSYHEKGFTDICCNCSYILSTRVYMHPVLNDYEYVMSLHPDSFLIGKIDYDPFVLMHTHGYLYSTIDTFKTKYGSTCEQCEITEKYVKEKNITPSFYYELLGDLENSSHICASGFDILKLDFWRNPDFKSYYNFIDSKCSIKGSYNCELFIPLLAASIFLPKEKVHFFNDIPYWHCGCMSNFSLDIHYRTKLAIKKMKLIKFLSNLSEKCNRIRKKESVTSTPEIDIFDYKGFNFFYNKDGVRANLMKNKDWTYDEDITGIIISDLKKSSHPTFLDIGSHLGFMTLNVVSEIENVKIYAFEPGPFQSSLLKRTIEINGLEDKVTLFKEALSNEAGTASFVCQETPDVDWSMGNGLIDTRRGMGVQQSIEVAVDTLDSWWVKTGKPSVDVIKMDTEGAELWILQGGTEFLSTCKPMILLEIQPLNLHVYPYGAKDIFVWFSERGYNLETIDGTLLTPNNFKTILRINENFIARYKY